MNCVYDRGSCVDTPVLHRYFVFCLLVYLLIYLYAGYCADFCCLLVYLLIYLYAGVLQRFFFIGLFTHLFVSGSIAQIFCFCFFVYWFIYSFICMRDLRYTNKKYRI